MATNRLNEVTDGDSIFFYDFMVNAEKCVVVQKVIERNSNSLIVEDPDGLVWILGMKDPLVKVQKDGEDEPS